MRKSGDDTGTRLVNFPSRVPVSPPVNVDGWTLHFGPPRGKTLDVGEYADAKKWPFNEDAPDLNFSGHGHSSHQVGRKFVIWELQVQNARITQLAADFIYRSEGNGPPLYGMLRLNSSME